MHRTKILLVEDHADMRFLMTLALSAKCDVVSLPTTWNLLNDPCYWEDADLLLMDWSLGEYTGNDVLHIADRIIGDIPCIIYTARDTNAISVMTQDRHDCLVISKHEVNINDLPLIISKFMSRLEDGDNEHTTD